MRLKREFNNKTVNNNLKQLMMIKKLLTLLVLIVATLGMSAQTISGTVTDLNGSGISNHQVHIMNNDSMNPYVSSTYTTGNGAYSFANVPSSPTGFIVYTFDCQQSFQMVSLSSNSGTANFQICVSSPASCNAMFYSYPDSLNPMDINFMDLSSGNPTSWSWSFGDGTSANTQNPTHTYASNGTYNVSLYISSALCSDTITMTITVGNTTPSCMASFYYVPDTANNNSIMFFDMSLGNPTTWAWDFGDGTTSTSQNPTHVYATQGNYNVTLSISSPNSGSMCTSSITQMIYVGSGGNPSGCQSSFTSAVQGLAVNFTDASTGNPTNWMWDFGDGSTSSVQNPAHTYASNGMYYISLTIAGPQNCTSYSDTIMYIGSTLNTYSLSGTVYDNGTAISSGFAAIFNTNTNNVVGFSLIDSLGGYNFQYVDTGVFIIGAVADTNFAPTYYGDVIFYSAATLITVTSNLTGLDINLVTPPVTPGAGTISGTVGSNSKANVDGLLVLLTDDSNSDALISSTITESNGNYVFDNIANGSYNIWVEIPGMTATPINVTIKDGNVTSTGNDFIITGNTVIPAPTSISDNAIVGVLNVYPNPVLNILNVEIDMEQGSKCSFEIYSIAGKLISAQAASMNAGSNLISINTSELAQGTYILKIENSANQTMQSLFVK